MYAARALAKLRVRRYTAWVSTTAYNGGATVSYASVNYTANWWTQGNEPDKNNGG
ncbi:MAG: carbohydrate-binding protein, partial [Bryobacteraceae bacterium]